MKKNKKHGPSVWLLEKIYRKKCFPQFPVKDCNYGKCLQHFWKAVCMSVHLDQLSLGGKPAEQNGSIVFKLYFIDFILKETAI